MAFAFLSTPEARAQYGNALVELADMVLRAVDSQEVQIRDDVQPSQSGLRPLSTRSPVEDDPDLEQKYEDEGELREKDVVEVGEENSEYDATHIPGVRSIDEDVGEDEGSTGEDCGQDDDENDEDNEDITDDFPKAADLIISESQHDAARAYLSVLKKRESNSSELLKHFHRLLLAIFTTDPVITAPKEMRFQTPVELFLISKSWKWEDGTSRTAKQISSYLSILQYGVLFSILKEAVSFCPPGMRAEE